MFIRCPDAYVGGPWTLWRNHTPGHLFIRFQSTEHSAWVCAQEIAQEQPHTQSQM